MASINSSLTLNPKESSEISKFIIEKIKDAPEFSKIHKLQTGITMKEQIVFASQFSKMGIADNLGATRPASGAGMNLTEKYWEQQNIGDTISIAIAQLPQLFKAWGDKIKSFKDQYDVNSNNELATLLTLMIEQGAKDAMLRNAWCGNKTVAAAGAGAAGLKVAGNAKFYNAMNGIWEQIFTGVGAGTIAKFAIAENAEATKAAQYSFAAKRASAIFEEVYTQADSRLIADPERYIGVNRRIYENYRQELADKGIYTNLGYLMNGFMALEWNGIPVYNMDNIWNRYFDADFAATSADLAYYLPNRVVFTTPANIPLGTINESDLGTIESYNDWLTRTSYFSFGYGLDAKLLEEYLISVAY